MRCACIFRCAVALLLVLVPTRNTWATDDPGEPAQSSVKRVCEEIELTQLTYLYPRPIRAYVARIDLSSPNVELVATCGSDFDDESETACATTLDFARAQRVQLAVNASPFRPFRSKAGEGMDVVGLGACSGRVYSASHAEFASLIETKKGDVRIVAPPIQQEALDKIDDAVGGFHLLIDDGKDITADVIPTVAEKFAGVNPRTAAGLSKDGRTLWLIVVDGRQENVSEGMTLAELAALGRRLECWDLLNLDGGGSSTMVLEDSRSNDWSVVNSPVGSGSPGSLRLVANNLGVRVRTDDQE